MPIYVEKIDDDLVKELKRAEGLESVFDGRFSVVTSAEQYLKVSGFTGIRLR